MTRLLQNREFEFLLTPEEEAEELDRYAKLEERREESYHDYLCSDQWKNIRESVVSRDKSKCVFCGSKYNLQVHHKRYGTKQKISDLITVCNSCHANEHKTS